MRADSRSGVVNAALGRLKFDPPNLRLFIRETIKMRLDPNVMLSELTGIDKMLETIKASEQAKTALTSELAEAKAALDAANADSEQNVAKVVELEAKVTELSAAVDALAEAEVKIAALEAEKDELATANSELEAMKPDTDAQAAEVQAMVDAAVETAAVENLAVIADLQTQLAATKAELDSLSAEADATKLAADALQAQTAAVANALDIRGEAPTDLSHSQDINKVAAIVARYQALSTSIYPAQKSEARKIYAEHKQEIVAFLDSKSGTTSAPVDTQSSESTITDEQLGLYNSWLADRATLMSSISRLSTEERTRLHVKNRQTYSANRELFDRCFEARSRKEN